MKTVLITGATAGFGLAASKRFIAEGWKVIGTGRRKSRLDEIGKELGENFYPLEFDIQKKQAVEEAVNSLPDGFSKIDTLVNNAGLALGLEPFHEAKMEDFETMVDTNIKGLLYITHLLAPRFVRQGAGHIINVGSTAGTYAYPGGNVYGSSKAFVNLLTQNLRADMVEHNVRTTSIEPGLCETEFSVVRFKGDEDKAKDFYAGMKPVTAEDIAETIFWCANLPSHVNINKLEVMPTQQGFGPFKISRSA